MDLRPGVNYNMEIRRQRHWVPCVLIAQQIK